MAVTGSFLPDAGLLSSFGDSLDNDITVSRNAAGAILLNGGAVAIAGGTPTVANTALIQVFGQGGNDTLTLSEVNGALPRANLFGGTGNDVLVGGSGADMLFGQADNDTLLGKGGNDFLFGGAGNDTLTGGDADDQLFGEGGDDRMIWNPGDDTDLHEGGGGNDTSEVNGGNGAENFTLTANGTRVRFDRIDPAPFSIDIGTTENIVVNMNGGDDTFSATGNLAALIAVTVDGGAGNDTILGSNGNDKLLGGDGNDFIDGQQGNDTALLGAGDDTFQWDPGDGSDVVEGGAGTDRMLFNGSAINEVFDLSANGGRAQFTRNVGAIVMDTNDVERIDVNALGGVDTFTIGNLTGTEVTEVNVSLAGVIGGTAGDAAADSVIVNGRTSADVIDVVGAGSSVSVLGLPTRVNITASEGANDSLVVNGGAGDDGITATTLPAGVIKLTLDGGAGNDTLLGSQGADLLLGGGGNDFVLGDNGDDTALLGGGNDTFLWNNGDGNDVIEGQSGTDTMVFFGANIGENINLAANGGRALFTRDIANVTMDMDDVERIDFRALDGVDNITVGDMSGTDVRRVSVDLNSPANTPDGAADTLTSNGTSGNDTISVKVIGNETVVTGLQAELRVSGADADLDRLTLNGQGGDDTINASGAPASGPLLTLNGGLGNDVLIGSARADIFNGGDGNDTALMGGGDDTFIWNPGDDNDIVEGQAGRDTMDFNGANIGERIDIFANGGRALFTRDIANVTMDLNDVERIQFDALGGADNITIRDLSGTDVQEIDINLAASGGAGDGATDSVTIEGTSGDDVVSGVGDASGVAVLGLAAQVNITGAEGASDRLVINLGAGDDVFDGSGLTADAIVLVVNGGAGNDVIIGGAGNDTLNGDAGDDVLIGGPGVDILDGGADDNVVIQALAPGHTFELTDFQAGAGTDDAIDLSTFGDFTFASVMAGARDVNGNVEFDLGNDHFTLIGVTTGQLHQDDFLI